MKDILDLHTHTIASGHAQNTIYEMARMASKRGLLLLGITDHGPRSKGVCKGDYFRNLKMTPRTAAGQKLLLGVELNIYDFDGSVDLPKEVQKEMDLCVASFHDGIMPHGSEEENTRAMIKAMANPFVNILGHPDDGRFPVRYEEVIKAAVEYHVLIEVNNHSLMPEGFRTHTWENGKRILELCEKYSARVILSSDAHEASEVGDHSWCWKLVQKEKFPEHLIVNGSVSTALSYVNEGRRKMFL